MRIERVVLKHHRDVALAPARARSTRRSPIQIAPESSGSSPASSRSSVVLPQPDGPEQHETLARFDVEIDAVDARRARRTASSPARIGLAPQAQYTPRHMTASDGALGRVGIGANSVDFVNLLPGYPQPIGPFAKMRIREQHILCGGQMATAMCACASLGLRAKYVGVTGTDDNGRRIRARAARARRRHQRSGHPRRREPVRGHPRRREHRRSHGAVGSRRSAAPARVASCRSKRSAATKVVHVDDVDDEVAIRAAEDRARAGAHGDERHRSADAAHRGAGRHGHARHLRAARPTHLTGLDDIGSARCASCARRSTTCWS